MSNRSISECTHLIIVCGHAIWLGGPTAGQDATEWALESFQAGETPTFIAHIQAGIDAYTQDERSALVFSGGATKPHITPASEAASYHALRPGVVQADTALIEDHATDSFQNVLLSLLLFTRTAGQPPSHVTIVSHAFKRERFMAHHLPALNWPARRARFLGIDPRKDPGGQKRIDEGEAAAVEQWSRDPWGWKAPLRTKRAARGWTQPPWLDASMRDLVLWDGGDSGLDSFSGRLPWCE